MSELGLIWPQCRFSVTSSQPKVIRIAAQFFVAFVGYQKIVFESQASASGPINPGFDGQHHPFLDGASSGLMRIGELMGTRSDPVTDGMRRLTRISTVRDTSAN